MIYKKIERLDSILKQYNAPVLNHLNPGLPKQDIIDLFAINNIYPNESLVALYEWHNGTNSLYGIQDSILEIIPFGKFFSLSDCIRMREMNIEWELIDFPEKFIPFLGSGESEMYMVENDLINGRIIYLVPVVSIDCQPLFNSIEVFLDFIIYCYIEGVIKIQGEEGIKYDEKKYAEARQKFRF